MQELRCVVKLDRSVGTAPTPHLHEDDQYVVSLTRYEKDYQRVKDEKDPFEWISKGYSVRMSNPSVRSHRSPSLITLGSIEMYKV